MAFSYACLRLSCNVGARHGRELNGWELLLIQDPDPQAGPALDFPALERRLLWHGFLGRDTRRLARCHDFLQIRFRNRQIAWFGIPLQEKLEKTLFQSDPTNLLKVAIPWIVSRAVERRTVDPGSEECDTELVLGAEAEVLSGMIARSDERHHLGPTETLYHVSDVCRVQLTREWVNSLPKRNHESLGTEKYRVLYIEPDRPPPIWHMKSEIR
jgi:hypothetical protein